MMQMPGGGWDPAAAFNPMMMGGMGGMGMPPGMDMMQQQFQQQQNAYMMGGAQPGAFMMQGGAPQMASMMGGPLDMPVRFTFPQQEQGPDGSNITKPPTVMEATFLDKSQETCKAMQFAVDLNREGKNQECIDLLSKLY